jgi:APA family basic amino acid/polyamine antiporter
MVPGEFGWSGVVRGAGVIFFAYIGFDAVSTAAQEAKNPQRDMPIGMLGSLGICTVLYIAVALVLTGVVNYTQAQCPAPIAVAINSLGPSLAWLRILHQDRRDRRAVVRHSGDAARPAADFLHDVEGRIAAAGFQRRASEIPTPWIAQILTGAIAMLVAGLFPIGLLGELVSIGTLLAFAIVCAGVFVLRFTDPEIPRPFRTPLFWLVAPLGVIFLRLSDVRAAADTWARLIVWMAIGFVIYFTYGCRHSEIAEAAAPARRKGSAFERTQRFWSSAFGRRV